MADQLEAYKKISEQMDAALAAYKNTAEGAGRVAQVARKLATNLSANRKVKPLHPRDARLAPAPRRALPPT